MKEPKKLMIYDYYTGNADELHRKYEKNIFFL